MFLCNYTFVTFFGKSYKTSKQNQSEELTRVNQTIFSTIFYKLAILTTKNEMLIYFPKMEFGPSSTLIFKSYELNY